MDLPDWRWLDISFLGNSLGAWVFAAGFAAVLFLFLILVRRLVIRRLGRIAERTASELDSFFVEIVRRTRKWLLILPVAWLGSLVVALPRNVETALRTVALLAVFGQLALWAFLGIDLWVASTRRKRLESDAASVTIIGALGFLAKLLLWTILALIALDNLGVNVTTLVTGLGIGGIAVALALQNILGDVLASLSIVVDKPFVLGDSIEVGDFAGTVEDVGLKTTRLRSVSGEQVIFSNSDLLQSRIRNFKRMTERRAVLSFGVTYGTPADVLEKIPGMVREIIDTMEMLRFSRAHFKSFGDSSLDFEVAYFVLSPEYPVFMDCQQSVNLALVKRFEQEGIEFAFPTRTVWLAGGADRPAPEPPGR